MADVGERWQRHPLLNEIRVSYGDGDPWGTTMAWWFACAGVLHDRGTTPVPEHWHYRPSPMGGADPENFEDSIAAEFDDDELVHAGNVLARYAARLRRAGLDY